MHEHGQRFFSCSGGIAGWGSRSRFIKLEPTPAPLSDRHPLVSTAMHSTEKTPLRLKTRAQFACLALLTACLFLSGCDMGTYNQRLQEQGPPKGPDIPQPRGDNG